VRVYAAAMRWGVWGNAGLFEGDGEGLDHDDAGIAGWLRNSLQHPPHSRFCFGSFPWLCFSREELLYIPLILGCTFVGGSRGFALARRIRCSRFFYSGRLINAKALCQWAVDQ
jgi:hypothetical protein